MEKDFKIICLIIAAGKSERFGQYKLLYKVKGKELISYTLNNYIDLCQNVFIITGFNSKKLTEFLKCKYKNHLDKLFFLFNKFYNTREMFFSIQLGINEILKKNFNSNKVFIIYQPADVPFVKKDTIKNLILFTRNNFDLYDVFYPSFDFKKGHPIIFKLKVCKTIIKENYNSNLRNVLKKFNAGYLKVNDPFILKDIDYLNDLNYYYNEKQLNEN